MHWECTPDLLGQRNLHNLLGKLGLNNKLLPLRRKTFCDERNMGLHSTKLGKVGLVCKKWIWLPIRLSLLRHFPVNAARLHSRVIDTTNIEYQDHYFRKALKAKRSQNPYTKESLPGLFPVYEDKHEDYCYYDDNDDGANTSCYCCRCNTAGALPRNASILHEQYPLRTTSCAAHSAISELLTQQSMWITFLTYWTSVLRLRTGTTFSRDASFLARQKI